MAPIHLLRPAVGVLDLDHLRQVMQARGDERCIHTRNIPKRADELLDGGSVYWILKHQLVARSEILGFEEAEGGRTNIVISTRLIDVHPKPKRAHQGWRYLEEADAPADLADGESADMLPPSLAGELAKLGLA